MYERQKMKKRLEQLFIENNNVLSKKQLLEFGCTKYEVKKLVDDGTLEHLRHGLYGLNNELKDEFYTFQHDNAYFVYSNETALFLHTLTDRYPIPLSVTTKRGYHLRNEKLKVYYVKEELLKNNIVEIMSPQGNPILVYDVERTICDIVKNKKRIEQQVYVQGLQNYFLKGKPNLRKLSKISKELHIQQKMMDIIELYMKP